jgi:membrane-associated protease RseP (regulator of RpoE activity)
VEIDPAQLAAQSYFPQMLILFGGILFNVVFAYAVLAYYLISNKLSQSNTVISSKEIMKQAVTQIMTRENANGTFIGPIGIISMIGSACAISAQCYWLILAILSLNMGILNMIPLPFFDGGKALLITIEAVIGTTISPYIVGTISMIFLVIFIAFITQITMNDIRRLIKN